MLARSAPFLVAPDQLLHHSGWEWRAHAGGTWAPLPEEIRDWDANTELSLAAQVEGDTAAILRACDLSASTNLALVVTAKSSSTKLELHLATLPIAMDAPSPLRVDVSVPAGEMGGRMTLSTFLIATLPAPLGLLAAREPSAILWRHQQSTLLEGIGSQFPTQPEDFRTSRPSRADAGWELVIDTTDPDAVFMSCVRLLINTGKPAMMRVLAGESDSQTRQLLTYMNWDVTRQLVHAALSLDEVILNESTVDPLSLVGVLKHVLSSVWPLESARVLKRRWSEEPWRLEAEIQSQCQVVP